MFAVSLLLIHCNPLLIAYLAGICQMQTVAEKTEEIRNLRINSIPVRITNREITVPHHNKNTNNYVTRKYANTQKRSWSNNLIHI